LGEKGFYDIAFKKEANDNVLGLLVTGPAASAYTDLTSEEVVVETVLAELDAIFDGEASANYLGEYRIGNWGDRPYIQGTWVVGAQISKRTLEVLNEPLHGKVYFAGEVNDVYQQMGVPGSILSGLEAIDRLLLEQD
jgi:monoamine oxidase